MFTRRRFMQGSAALLGALSAARAAVAAPVAAPMTIDSAETPFFDPGPCHLRLSGSQLDRFQQLRALFADPAELRIELYLDAAADVLLDTALNAAGRSVSRRDRSGATQSLTIQRLTTQSS